MRGWLRSRAVEKNQHHCTPLGPSRSNVLLVMLLAPAMSLQPATRIALAASPADAAIRKGCKPFESEEQ